MTYTPPTPTEFRALLARWHLTGKAAAGMLACTERQIRRYTATRGQMTVVPFAVLYTLASEVESARVTVEGWREALDILRVGSPK